MASLRIAYDKTKPMGVKVALLAQFGLQYRQYLEEVSRQMEAYVDDNTTLATDLGATSASTAGDLRSRIFNAAAEMTGNVVVTITGGTHGPNKDLLDFIG